ncbi:MAG: Trm112 family protein [Porticoccaceae bacterium]|nr:Trm112 family protein [Porticoccaceae bacterium]
MRKLARFSNGLFVVDKKLLSILVCPVSKAPLEYDKAKQELVCRASGLAYPINEGIPVMLESEARQLSADEKLRDSGK